MRIVTSVFDLTPTEFEDLSVEYLRSKRFSDVCRVGQAGDLGVDIRCNDPQGRFVVAQCKRYRADRTIGSPDIQRFFGMVVHAGASRGIFITTSDYTQPARNLSRDRDIELVNGSQIGAFYREKIRRQEEAERERLRLFEEAERERRQALENAERKRLRLTGDVSAQYPEKPFDPDFCSYPPKTAIQPPVPLNPTPVPVYPPGWESEPKVDRARRWMALFFGLLMALVIGVSVSAASFDVLRDWTKAYWEKSTVNPTSLPKPSATSIPSRTAAPTKVPTRTPTARPKRTPLAFPEQNSERPRPDN